jgi:hypothetical protein
MKQGTAAAHEAVTWVDRRLAEKTLAVGARTVQRLARRGLIRRKIVPRAGGGISYLYAEQDVRRLAAARRAGQRWSDAGVAPESAAVRQPAGPPAPPAFPLQPLQQAIEQLARSVPPPKNRNPSMSACGAPCA